MTMKSATRWIGALTAVALVPGLAACGSSAPAGSAGTVDGSTIVLSTVAGLEPAFTQYADAYMAEYPDRTVEVRSATDDFTGYAQSLATARISGELPDVFFNVDSLANTLADNDVTLDLAPGIAAGKLGDLELDDFLPQYVSQYRPLSDPDLVTGLPVSADSTALFWNRTLFEEAGIDEYPTAEWEWSDLIRVATEIQTASGGAITGLAAPLLDGTAQIFYGPVIDASGGYVYDPETNTSGIGQPEAIEAWEMLIGAYGTASGDYTTTNDDPTVTFRSGQVAMGIRTSADVPATREALKGGEWDVVEMPTIDGNSTSGGGSYGLSIAQTSEQQDAAWAFLAWFYDIDGGMAVAQEIANTIPPTIEGLEAGSWREASPPPAGIAVFADTAADAVLAVQLPGTVGSILDEATMKATQQVVLEGRDIAEAFQEAEATVNAALSEQG